MSYTDSEILAAIKFRCEENLKETPCDQDECRHDCCDHMMHEGSRFVYRKILDIIEQKPYTHVTVEYVKNL